MPADNAHFNAGVDSAGHTAGLGGREWHDAPKPQSDARSVLPEQLIVAPKQLGVHTRLEFRRAASMLLEFTCASTGRLIVDCARLESIDSAGLNALILVQRKAAKRRVQVILVELNPELRRLFVLTKLHDLFHFQDGDAR